MEKQKVKQRREDSGVQRDEISTRMVSRGSTEKPVCKRENNSARYLFSFEMHSKIAFVLI